MRCHTQPLAQKTSVLDAHGSSLSPSPPASGGPCVRQVTDAASQHVAPGRGQVRVEVRVGASQHMPRTVVRVRRRVSPGGGLAAGGLPLDETARRAAGEQVADGLGEQGDAARQGAAVGEPRAVAEGKPAPEPEAKPVAQLTHRSRPSGRHLRPCPPRAAHLPAQDPRETTQHCAASRAELGARRAPPGGRWCRVVESGGG